MAEGKAKFIKDAVRVIEGRVEDLKAELERREKELPAYTFDLAGDRAAILEAEHLARLIRSLAVAPYHRDPYEIARERWAQGMGEKDD